MNVKEIKQLSIPNRKTIYEIIREISGYNFFDNDGIGYCDYKLKDLENKIVLFDGVIYGHAFFKCFLNSNAILIFSNDSLYFPIEEKLVGKILFFAGKDIELFKKKFKECGLISYPEKHEEKELSKCVKEDW